MAPCGSIYGKCVPMFDIWHSCEMENNGQVRRAYLIMELGTETPVAMKNICFCDIEHGICFSH